VPGTPLELVTQGDLVTQVVLAILAVLSLVSWSVMLAKASAFGRAEKAGRDLVREVEKGARFEQAAALARRGDGAFARVVQRATEFVSAVRAPAAETGAAPALSASQVEALRLVLDAETDAAREALGRGIPSLAMIASASPLIGLLGTVLGIIEAFVGLSTEGSGNIGAIAPGVATALVATAAALAVAIPAVFGYNIFAARLARFEGRLERFGTELIALMAREGRI
jgi:biopolymer transport protein TolQ